MPAERPVVRDADRNRNFAIYFTGLATAGTLVIIATVVRHWGLYGYLGGGFLAVAGLGSLVSQVIVGGAGIGTCPACGGTFKVINIGMRRVLPCPTCNRWLHGARTMSEVGEDHVDATAVFDVPLPTPFTWPEGCPTCAGPATRTIQVRGVDAAGATLAMAAPIGITKVATVDAPACDLHDSGVKLSRAVGDTLIAFRSRSYLERFAAANGITAAEISAAYWRRSDGVRLATRALNRH